MLSEGEREREGGGEGDVNGDVKTAKLAPSPGKPKAKESGGRKLSYKEELELKALPEQIEELEARVGEVQAELAEPDFYKRSQDDIADAQRRLQELEQRLNEHYARWEELAQRESYTVSEGSVRVAYYSVDYFDAAGPGPGQRRVGQ